jgi:hypothetical protein
MDTPDPPVNLVIPNTSGLKLQAILSLSQAILELSKAISSSNVVAYINNNTINGVHTGIVIETKDDIPTNPDVKDSF